MRREIDDFTFGWMNGEANLTWGQQHIHGAYIKTDSETFYFDIKFDSASCSYKISHSVALQFPWCGTRGRVECFEMPTFKGERVATREVNIEKAVTDWFVAFYGSAPLLKKHFGLKYETRLEEGDSLFQEVWSKNYESTQKAMRQFAEDFCLT